MQEKTYDVNFIDFIFSSSTDIKCGER
jgi:hypothetical protein